MKNQYFSGEDVERITDWLGNKNKKEKPQLVSVKIKTSHKLKTTWTVEMAQDLAAYHSIDVGAEIENFKNDYSI